MKNIQSNKGITIVALIITVITLMILIGVSINEGKKFILDVKADNAITNMLGIKGKAKVFAEETNAKIWNLTDEEKHTRRVEIYQSDYNMTECTDLSTAIVSDIDNNVKNEGYEAYTLTDNTLEKMGLNELIDEASNKYVVVYNSKDFSKLDIVFLDGVNYKNNVYYTLTKLQQVLE